MCRFALYLGSPILVSSLVTEPANSIIHQSFHSHEREEPLNGDGFGLAWYAPQITDEPTIFKDVTPAWSNENLLNLARVIETTCLLAHVRAATSGLAVTRLNCHPFGWRSFAFMHNGTIGGFRRLVRRLRRGLSDEAYQGVGGTTDSEHVFALFADHYRQSEETQVIERMASSLCAAIRSVEEIKRAAGVEEPALLNLAVADGRRAVVSRYITRDPERANTLYVHAGGAYRCEAGVCRMVEASQRNQAVIMASEPLSDDPGWQPVEPNHLVVVHENLTVDVRPLEV